MKRIDKGREKEEGERGKRDKLRKGEETKRERG